MKKVIFLSLLLFLFCAAIAQSPFSTGTTSWLKGEDLNFLQNVKTIKAVIHYDSIIVGANAGEKKFVDSAAYYIEKNGVKGDGEKFVAKWNNSKEDLFPKYFDRYFENNLKKVKIKGGTKINPGNLIVHIYPLKVETGSINMIQLWFSGGTANFRLIFEDPATNEIVANVLMKDIPGRPVGPDYDKSFIGGLKNCFLMCGFLISNDIVLKQRAKSEK